MYYGTETISVLGSKLWIILLKENKNFTGLEELKTKIKNLMSQNCLCCLGWFYLVSIMISILNLFV